jgi:hypothetical protein
MTQALIPFNEISMGFGNDQALITVTSRNSEFNEEDERIGCVLGCLVKHKLHINTHWFREQRLMI